MIDWEKLTLEAWQQQGTKLFGPDVNNWQFVCPSCGHIQSRFDWIKLGLNPRMIDQLLGYSCIGRWLDPMGAVPAFELSNGTGCRYLGGLEPNISPITLILSENPREERPTFGWAY